MDEIVVIGGGGHSKVLMSVLLRLPFKVLGYTDEHDRSPILGVAYLGTDSRLEGLVASHPDCGAAIGIGKIDSSALRRDVHSGIRALGFHFPVIVSPAAIVNVAVGLGAGTVVFDGAVVNSGADIGAICILNTNCTVEHDCRLSDNVHVGPGATISGGTTIGANSMVGAGATVIQGVTICSDVLVGAGSTVVDDILAPGTYVGNPARRVS